MHKTLVTSYVCPDLDGFSCVIAYTEYLNKTGGHAEEGIFMKPQLEARYLMDRFKFQYPSTVADPCKYDEIVLLDESAVGQLDERIDPKKIVQVIDHRVMTMDNPFPNAKLHIELVGAAATLVAEYFYKNNVPISDMSARLLHAAIISNTFNFRSAVTTDRDKAMARWLNEKAPLPDGIARDMFLAKSNWVKENLEEALAADFTGRNFSGRRIGIAQVEIIEVPELLKANMELIPGFLDKLKKDEQMNIILMSAVDLELEKTFFFAHDKEAQELMKKVLGLKFKDNQAVSHKMLLRKQIWPKIKETMSAS